MNTNAIFGVSETKECVGVNIQDTSVVETTESFFVILERTKGLDERIQLDPATMGEIEIIDNDGTCDICILYVIALKVGCLMSVIHLSHQWLQWVWRRLSTPSQRM